MDKQSLLTTLAALAMCAISASAATITTGDATGTNWSGTAFQTISSSAPPNAKYNRYNLKQGDTNGIVQSFTATSNMTVGTISILASRLYAGVDFVVEVYQFLPGKGGASYGANPDRFRLYDATRSTLLKSYSLNSAVGITSGVKGATQLNIILDEAERFSLIAGNAYGIRIRSATTTTNTAGILNWDYQEVTSGNPTPYAGGTYGVPAVVTVLSRDLGLAFTATPEPVMLGLYVPPRSDVPPGMDSVSMVEKKRGHPDPSGSHSQSQRSEIQAQGFHAPSETDANSEKIVG